MGIPILVRRHLKIETAPETQWFVCPTLSVSGLLMPWRSKEPVHQLPWYWPIVFGNIAVNPFSTASGYSRQNCTKRMLHLRHPVNVLSTLNMIIHKLCVNKGVKSWQSVVYKGLVEVLIWPFLGCNWWCSGPRFYFQIFHIDGTAWICKIIRLINNL